MWLDRLDAEGAERRLIRGGSEEVVQGVRAVKTGGHFDGSLVLGWEEEGVLCVADTFVTVPVSFFPTPSIFLLYCFCEGLLTFFLSFYWAPFSPSLAKDIPHLRIYRVVGVLPHRSPAGHDVLFLHVEYP